MTDTVVLIPTYNNAGTLENVLRRALAQGLPVLVVDDGSTDHTAEILSSIPEVKVVRHERNRGKGQALKTGFRKARSQGYKFAVTLDSDGQHFPEDIPALLAAAGDRTLVVGSRPRMGADGGGSFANRFSNFWFRLYTWTALPDTQTGFRLYPLDQLPSQSLLSARYEAELTLLVFSAWKGLEARARAGGLSRGPGEPFPSLCRLCPYLSPEHHPSAGGYPLRIPQNPVSKTLPIVFLLLALGLSKFFRIFGRYRE